jgi:hypothetical protein
MATARRLEGANPHEHPKERLDRELGELLEEIRVLLPGIEILFGFLIILPFSEGFGHISGYERGVYLASLLARLAARALRGADDVPPAPLSRRRQGALLFARTGWSSRPLC